MNWETGTDVCALPCIKEIPSRNLLCSTGSSAQCSGGMGWGEVQEGVAAKSLQSCPTLCNPIDGSHQAPPSLGFSRQEHWSGLPFPSPMHESEVTQSCPTLSDPMDCMQPTRLLRPWDFPGKSTGVGCHRLKTL